MAYTLRDKSLIRPCHDVERTWEFQTARKKPSAMQAMHAILSHSTPTAYLKRYVWMAARQVATEIFVSTLWYPRMKFNATATASRGKMRVEYAPHASSGGGVGVGVDGGGRVLVYPAGGVVAGARVVVTIV
eukprot:COSAG06_NODE_18948_length_860_cov_2.742444_3_plen_130_part_01